MVDIIEGEAVEVEPRALTIVQQPGQAIVAADTDQGPLDMLTRATAIATALTRMVEAQQLYTLIQGKKYPQVEAWMTIGRMDNVVAREAGNPERHEDGSYEAVVELIRLSDGMVIGRGSALCGTKGDRPWDTRAEPARRSMAVTRATSRAFRQQYSWIMALAGYEPTPADEMPQPDREQTEQRAELERRADGLIGEVSRGAAPADLELRYDSDSVAFWGFKLKAGRTGYQAFATGPLAEQLRDAALLTDPFVGQQVQVWGKVETVPFVKGDKQLQYSRIVIERLATADWVMPPAADTVTVPMFDEASA